MDSHLRLILLVMGGIVVSFILLESWFRRRQSKSAAFTAGNKHAMSISADQVLGLNGNEPQMNTRNVAEVAANTHFIRPDTTSQRSNATYANKTYSADKGVSTFLNDLLIITVVPTDAEVFASYDLLQAISTTGMQYGEMNIFHYKIGNQTLFSLSSATEPGDFNLDRMGDLTCEGLTLFANLREAVNPESVFDLLLSTAEQLAEDLNGELRAGTRRPWNDETYEAYRQKVMHYQLMKSH